MSKRISFLFVVGAALIFLLTSTGIAQVDRRKMKTIPAKVDSLKLQGKKPGQAKRAKKAGVPIPEFELGEINIEAIIEKPNVDIFPKRIKAHVDEISFIDRTFEPEIKEIPRHLLLYDEELDSAKKLSRLKKILIKKQKDLKK